MDDKESEEQIASLKEQIATMRLLLGIRKDTINRLRSLLMHAYAELTSEKPENDDEL